MIRILTITGYYLPGYRGGGPIRSVVNIVESLGDKFEFLIVTSDRDLGQDKAYEGIIAESWNDVGNAKVRYLAPNEMKVANLLKQIRSINYDIIYLNGLFLSMSVKILFFKWARLIDSVPVVLAPRGELSPGALGLKNIKKRIYLNVTKIIRLYSNIYWQVSSDFEKQDLVSEFQKQISKDSNIFIVPNLPYTGGNVDARSKSSAKLRGSAKIVFLSRISRMKNLDVAIELLSEIDQTVDFDIYGPMEEREYWHECQNIISRLPKNITVNYYGEIHPRDVINIFSKYHLFLFPTRGENYGRVILEALSVGCLILTSDRTPWRNLESQKIGWDVSLNDLVLMKRNLELLITMDQQTFDEWSKAAISFGKSVIESSEHVEAHEKMFRSVLH